MHFTNTNLDGPLFAELTEQRVFTSEFWTSLSKPEEGDLTNVLLDQGDKFNDEKWAYWLVKRHAFSRIPSLEPDRHFYEGLRWTAKTELIAKFFGCFPFHVRDGTAFIASVRPDVRTKLDEILAWLKASRAYVFAITPRELRFWNQLKRATN